MLFYQYLQNNGEGVNFEAIAKPEWERGDHMTPLKKALEHEKFVTASIDAIYAAAYEAKDFRAMQMLDWFIKEQGEEEKNAADLIKMCIRDRCRHLSRRSLAYSSSALHAGQSASPLVPCTPQQYRRTMRVTVSISFSLFKF